MEVEDMKEKEEGEGEGKGGHRQRSRAQQHTQLIVTTVQMIRAATLILKMLVASW